MSDINTCGQQMTVGLNVGDKHVRACFLDHQPCSAKCPAWAHQLG